MHSHHASSTFLKLGIAALVAFGAGCSAHGGEDVVDDTPTDPAVTTSEAIVHGAADRDRHPAVVALVATDASGTALCTGTLIAPDLVLTARHCVSHLASEEVNCPPTGAQVGANRAPSTISVILGPNVDKGEVAAKGLEIITPPGNTLCDQDIALLRLDHPIADVEPLEITRESKETLGGTILSIGFGRTRSAGKAGTRRFRTGVPIVSSTSTEFVVGESTCQGDSGGPAIDEETGSILGVVSRGGMSCAGKDAQNVYTRVDAFLSMIDDALHVSSGDSADAGAGSTDAGHHRHKGKKPPKTDVGEPCTAGATCAAGVCIEPDGYCSKECGKGHGRCPHGFRCAKKDKASGIGACVKR